MIDLDKNAKDRMPTIETALPGRLEKVSITETHFVNGHRLEPPFPDGMETALFSMGCYWGAEKVFWQQEGVYSTAVGYVGGFTQNPSYEEVCTGMTGHSESVRIIFDPKIVGYEQLLILFWEGHDPTQGMRQGNDKGTAYRSGIYTFSEEQKNIAVTSMQNYAAALSEKKYGPITTEIIDAPIFYYAEDDHQQYLAKNPQGYCGLGGSGVCYIPD
ncbi:MAG: peptide-methionine (S)-S-oxide reductase [Thiothrix sp.]|nr:MAG: peptide-methionine (S)-S-oxide reductase [Thiothrix sp.]